VRENPVMPESPPPDSLPWTGDAEANSLLAHDPLALLIGMLLDQQFPMERAFYGPHLLSKRLGEPLDVARLATLDPERLEAIFKGPPAIHRFPGAFARRTRDLCAFLVERYGGDPSQLWKTARSGAELQSRLEALPGFGVAKARIFVGVLGKRMGVRPPGWEEAAADWPSIADVAAWEDVFTLRQQKRELKAARKETEAETLGQKA
jgi:uncharacterized HhH-GPD family protein